MNNVSLQYITANMAAESCFCVNAKFNNKLYTNDSHKQKTYYLVTT